MPAKKILLAEDDSDDQKLFFEFLHQRKDIELMQPAENGVELFESLDLIMDAKDLPGFIILDQNMPKRNGLQTLKLLKETNRYADIPVMIYSTYTDQQLIQMSKETGASLVMTKPITKEGYHKMIDAFFDTKF
jgi:CheY-like chemotaxis protein